MEPWFCGVALIGSAWSGAAKELTEGVIQILFLEESPLEVQSMLACSYLWYGPTPSTDTTNDVIQITDGTCS